MASEAKNEKNKTTLFYQTFKVQNVKVVLFFYFLAFLIDFLAIFGFKLKNHNMAK